MCAINTTKPDMLTVKIAILASGSGSNAENIIKYFSGRDDVEFPLIISNKADAYVHKRAEQLGIKSYTLSREEIKTPSLLIELLRKYDINLIVLAGYLLKIPAELINEYPGKIINIHPALLPKFGGKGMYGDFVHEAVINSGEKFSGITIHLVNENYDEGEHLFQAKCDIVTGETAQSLASKVHELEYLHFPAEVDRYIKKIYF